MLDHQMQAWRETEYDSAWTPFAKKFRFRPSTTIWPAYLEPPDSVTYHIGHVYGDADNYERLTLDLSRKTISALRCCVGRGEFVFALDWQHQTYRFYPHESFEYESEADWPIPVLPNGDYYIFVSPRLDFGILGHPWEQTMCVFGQPLLDALARDQPTLLDRPIRNGGSVV